MKILFVVEYYFPHIGGVETFFQHLAEGLAAKGIEVEIVTSCLPGTKMDEVLNGVAIHRIRLPRLGLRYWFTLCAVFPIWRRASSCDVIHTTTYNAAFPAWLAAKLLRKKVLITVHEIWGDLWFRAIRMNKLSAWLHWLFERFVVRLTFDAYVGVSDVTRSAIQAVHRSGKNIQRIYHGIDYQLFDPTMHDGAKERERLNLGSGFLYLYFGRTGWAKGIDSLLESVPEIAQAIPGSYCLLLLSRDPVQPFRAIEETIRRLGIGQKVKLIDPLPRNELPNLLSVVDCVVVPSISEGFGFTTAESCAMGKPVAVSRAGSLPEVASGDVHFFEPGDPKGIARAVIDIAKGQRALVPQKRFEWETAISAYEALYRKLLERPA
ncbi:MAG: glycosyltransferase family 4 protein [Candidatus Kerfeldbacteria bacterium]